jgi:hypothetical protein
MANFLTVGDSLQLAAGIFNIRNIVPKGKKKETLGLVKKIKEGEDITSF